MREKDRIFWKRTWLHNAQIADHIKFYFFGRTFIIDDIKKIRSTNSKLELMCSTLDGKKTYKGVMTIWHNSMPQNKVWLGRRHWSLEPLQYEDDKLYLIREGRIESERPPVNPGKIH